MDEAKRATDKQREVNIMRTATKILDDDMTFAREMRIYIADLKKQQNEAPEQSQRDAKEALRRTGVTTSKGATKKRIVSWE